MSKPSESLPYWRDKNKLHLSDGVFDMDALTFKEHNGISYQVFYINTVLQYQDKSGFTIYLAPAAQRAYKDMLAKDVMREMMADG